MNKFNQKNDSVDKFFKVGFSGMGLIFLIMIILVAISAYASLKAPCSYYAGQPLTKIPARCVQEFYPR